MIEEQGRVVAREPGAIWVETVRAGTCSSCPARQGCGHSVINRQAAGQRARLRVVAALSFRDGDPVASISRGAYLAGGPSKVRELPCLGGTGV